MLVQKLSQDQTNWIFLKVKKITDEYLAKVPFKQCDWNCLVRDLNNIAEKAHQDCLYQKLALGVIDYFEELHKEKHHVFVKEGEAIESAVQGL